MEFPELFDKYLGKTLYIYPFCKKNTDNYGDLSITKEQYDSILKIYSETKSTLSKYNFYQYRDMQMKLINDTKHVSLNKCLDVFISNVIYVVYDISVKDSMVFPILNKYHNESIRKEYCFSLGSINLYLIDEKTDNNNTYYCYLSCVVDKLHLEEIDQILKNLGLKKKFSK